MNRLVEVPVEQFDIAQWNVMTLSDKKKQQEYKEVIEWLVGYSDEFIKAEEKKLNK